MSRQTSQAKISGRLKARIKKCEELPHDKINFSHFLPKIQETENCANKADEETAINDFIKH